MWWIILQKNPRCSALSGFLLCSVHDYCLQFK